jgi:predicted O-methyltransferase YrrM
MHGSTFTKVVRLGAHLVSRPGLLPRYLRLGPFSGRTPVELELPWIAWDCIDFLTSHLKPNMQVFEWGSGGSTLFLGRRVRQVVSVEENGQWHQRVQTALARAKLGNVELRHCPFEVGNAPALRHSEYLKRVTTGTWDVILVDGNQGYGSGGPHGTHRLHCFQLAEKHVSPGGIIVVDDSWMFPEITAQAKAKRRLDCVSIGPCRPGVTSTSVFFY